MASHGNLSWSNSPHMEIVNLIHLSLTVAVLKVFPHLFNADVLGSTLHEATDAALDDGDGCEEDNQGEEVGAKRVSIPELWLEVDHQGGDDNSNTHQHITHNVEVGGIDQHTLACLSMTVAVVVAVVVVVMVIVSMSIDEALSGLCVET